MIVCRNRLCVLFAGNAGHGKDTAANILAQVFRQRGASAERMAFADPIKDISLHLLGIPKSISYGTQQDKETYKVYDKTARHWMQWIGTEFARNMVHQDIWVHRFVDRALDVMAPVVIGSDCRFRNEMNVVRELLAGKMRVRIYKIINPRVPVNLKHQSESEVFGIPAEDFDGVIVNDETMADLTNKIVALADGLSEALSVQV